jgi:hypothetical protein
MTQIPDWMTSMYFYREMSPLLRYSAVPFLLLFQVSLLYVFVLLLDLLGIWSLPNVLVGDALRWLGVLGVLIDVVLVVNLVVIFLLVLLAIPLFFLARDVRRTLERFGLVGSDDPQEVEDRYTQAARELFAEHPDVAVYVYGHTHRAAVIEVNDRLVVNTGTWLKRFHRRSVLLGLLPRVYYPSYQLNYVRISEADGDVLVEYEVVPKANPRELTRLESLLTLTPDTEPPIPRRSVVVGADGPVESDPEPTVLG